MAVVVDKLLAIIATTQDGIEDLPMAQELRRAAICRLAEELTEEPGTTSVEANDE
jgi:hypothetical protein